MTAVIPLVSHFAIGLNNRFIKFQRKVLIPVKRAVYILFARNNDPYRDIFVTAFFGLHKIHAMQFDVGIRKERFIFYAVLDIYFQLMYI